MTTEQQIEPVTQADALLREIFLHGHVEGWTGNQNRRDAQHVDAEKGWLLYVSNGALEKTKARHNTTPAPSQHSELADRLEWFATRPIEYAAPAIERTAMLDASKALRQPPSDAMAAIEAMMAPWLVRYNAGEKDDPRFNGLIDGAGLALKAVAALTQGKPDA